MKINVQLKKELQLFADLFIRPRFAANRYAEYSSSRLPVFAIFLSAALKTIGSENLILGITLFLGSVIGLMLQFLFMAYLIHAFALVFVKSASGNVLRVILPSLFLPLVFAQLLSFLVANDVALVSTLGGIYAIMLMVLFASALFNLSHSKSFVAVVAGLFVYHLPFLVLLYFLQKSGIVDPAGAGNLVFPFRVV